MAISVYKIKLWFLQVYLNLQCAKNAHSIELVKNAKDI